MVASSHGSLCRLLTSPAGSCLSARLHSSCRGACSHRDVSAQAADGGQQQQQQLTAMAPPDIRKLAKMAQMAVTDQEVSSSQSCVACSLLSELAKAKRGSVPARLHLTKGAGLTGSRLGAQDQQHSRLVRLPLLTPQFSCARCGVDRSWLLALQVWPAAGRGCVQRGPRGPR